MVKLTLRQGMTDPLIIQCLELLPGATANSAYNLTGATVIEVHARPMLFGSTTVIPLGSKLAVSDATHGKLSLTADALSAGEYEAWVKVTDAAGLKVSFPNGESFRLTVLQAF